MPDPPKKPSAIGREFIGDVREWPLVRIKAPMADPEIDSFFVLINRYLERRTRFGIVFDVRGMPLLNALQRKKFADYITAKSGALKQFIAGQAVIVNSNLEAGIVTAVLWVAPTPFPTKVFNDYGDGEEWVKKQLPADFSR